MVTALPSPSPHPHLTLTLTQAEQGGARGGDDEHGGARGVGGARGEGALLTLGERRSARERGGRLTAAAAVQAARRRAEERRRPSRRPRRQRWRRSCAVDDGPRGIAAVSLVRIYRTEGLGALYAGATTRAVHRRPRRSTFLYEHAKQLLHGRPDIQLFDVLSGLQLDTVA